MTRDQFAEWVETHGPCLRGQLTRRYAAADVEDAWQTVMLRLYRADRVSSLDESRVSGYLYRACVKELTMQRRGQEREAKRLKALAMLEGQNHATDDEQAEVERVLRALPKGALRTAAWLIYACEWSVDDATACVGMSSKEFKAGWRAKAYRQARAQLARFVRRR